MGTLAENYRGGHSVLNFEFLEHPPRVWNFILLIKLKVFFFFCVNMCVCVCI